MFGWLRLFFRWLLSPRWRRRRSTLRQVDTLSGQEITDSLRELEPQEQAETVAYAARLRVRAAQAALDRGDRAGFLEELGQLGPPELDPDTWQQRTADLVAERLAQDGGAEDALALYAAHRRAGGAWLPEAVQLIVTAAREGREDRHAALAYLDYLCALGSTPLDEDDRQVEQTLRRACGSSEPWAEQLQRLYRALHPSARASQPESPGATTLLPETLS
jgi:hypothetical protein